jgi:sugar lactone lactonase YvrE
MQFIPPQPCRSPSRVFLLLLLLLTFAVTATASAQVINTPNTLYRIAAVATDTPDILNASVSRTRLPLLTGIVGKSNQLWIVDNTNHVVLRVRPDGKIETVAGLFKKCGTGDGKSIDTRLCFPTGIAVDSNNSVYISDTAKSVIRKVNENVVSTVAGVVNICDSDFGIVHKDRLCSPTGLSFDASDKLYAVSPFGAIYRINVSTGKLEIIARSDENACAPASNFPTRASFCRLSGIAVDRSTGNLYVTDSAKHTVLKVTPEGVVTNLAGKAGEAGANDGRGDARFHGPQGIAIDSAGNLYVADTKNSTIRKITPDGLVSTVAGAPESHATVLGTLPGSINTPMAIAVLSRNQLAITTASGDVLGINF